MSGWSVGEEILHTEDGGETWAQQVSPTSVLDSVFFADAQLGWATGASGTILRTEDAGVICGTAAVWRSSELRSVCVFL